MSLTLAPEGRPELRKAELAFMGEFHGIEPASTDRALDYGRFLINLGKNDLSSSSTRLASGIIEVAIVAGSLGETGLVEEAVMTARAICDKTHSGGTDHSTRKATETIDILKVATISTILLGGDYYPETQTRILDRVRTDLGGLLRRSCEEEARKKLVAKRRDILALGLLGLTEEDMYFFEPSPLLRNTRTSLQAVVCHDQGRRVVTESINVNGIGIPATPVMSNRNPIFIKSKLYRPKPGEPISSHPSAHHIGTICWEDYISDDELKALESTRMSPGYSAHLRTINTMRSTVVRNNGDHAPARRMGMLRAIQTTSPTFSLL